jgi:hypothetical protein
LAVTEISLLADPRGLAGRLNILVSNESDLENIGQILLNELNREDHWLMILDNLRNVELSMSSVRRLRLLQGLYGSESAFTS